MSVGGFAGQLGPGDIERALARFGPLTTVWQVQTVQAQNQVSVVRADNTKVVPVLGPSLAADFVGADVAWVTGVLAGMPVGGASVGQFQTTIQQITSTAGPPPVTSVLFADPWPADPQPGDQFVIIRNLSRRTVVTINPLPGVTVVASAVDLQSGLNPPVVGSTNITLVRLYTQLFNSSQGALNSNAFYEVFVNGVSVAGYTVGALAAVQFSQLEPIDFSPGIPTTAAGVSIYNSAGNVQANVVLIVAQTPAP